MANATTIRQNRWIRASRSFERQLYRLCVYGLPAIIVLLSVIAYVSWDTAYPAQHARTLAFRAFQDVSGDATPDAARLVLLTRPETELTETHLSEQPFWLLFTVGPVQPEHRIAIEFPSRHTQDLRCWDADSLQLLGKADRAASSGRIDEVKAGFSLAVPNAEGAQRMLCRAVSVGPAKLTVLEWPVEDLAMSDNEFQRNAGLLNGGMVILALFMGFMAITLKRSIYALFAVWLTLNLRVGALSAGCDTQWLGQAIPVAWLSPMRSLTMALCLLLTVALIRSLFSVELKSTRRTWLIRLLLWLSVALVAVAIVLPYGRFLPVMWVTLGIAISGMVFVLAEILIRTRSRVAAWYAASLGVLLLSNLYEVISAALGFQALIGAVNSVTGALASSVLATLAVAERMRHEYLKRRQMQVKLSHAFAATPIGLFTLDQEGRFLSGNPALAAMLGRDVEHPYHDRWSACFGDTAWPALYSLISRHGEAELEVVGRHHADGDQPKRFFVKAVLSQGKIEGWLQDVTEKSKAMAELNFLANHDPLTKAYNRRGIEQIYSRFIQQAGAGEPMSLAYLDLDRFKLINDLYSHATGDEILRQVCNRIESMLSGGHFLGRVGGDEFVIVMTNTAVSSAESICRGIADSILGEVFRIGDKAFHLRVSIGLTEVEPGIAIKDALATADRACRAAKSGPSDGIVIYERGAKAVKDRLAEMELVACMSEGRLPEGLYLEMQPIMSLKRPYESLNFEVLIRMREEDGTIVPAARILSAAETSGATGLLDRWVLRTTIDWINRHADRLERTHFVCLNFSGASLNDARFVADAYRILAESGDVARRLCIEITESVALHDLTYTRRFIDQVRSAGVRVALDDFGAGYTSFSYLKDLPADVLKIDGSFIVNMNAHPTNVAIVETIVNLAKNLGMATIAEWAEDTETVKTLAEAGIDYVQGYAIARPRLPDALLRASSAADFIEDQDLLAFLRILSQEDQTLPGLRLLDFSEGSVKR